MIAVERVEPAGAASRAGLRPGDRILSIDGYPVSDMLDLAPSSALLTAAVTYSRAGSIRTSRLRRNPGDRGWGVWVAGQAPRRCRNKCIFCFVDQQPPGLRASLMHKDDDIRYSFLQGTYVTLDHRQVESALSRGLSPVYVSVHATDPLVRGRMLGRKGGAPVLRSLERLRDAGIRVLGQVVVVPGINDGTVLESTLSQLLSKRLVSELGVVPVGLTSHRRGLPSLRRPYAAEAATVIEQCQSASVRASQLGLGRWVRAADEFYILAGMDIPPISFYDGCSLRENGIGMVAEALATPADPRGRGTVVTGSMAAPYLRSILKGSGYEVLSATNRLFGPMVGAAGLLSGADVIEVIRRSPACREAGPVFLPAVMFNSQQLTLDGMTAEAISRSAGAAIVIADSLASLP